MFLFDAALRGSDIEPIRPAESRDWFHCRSGLVAIHTTANRPVLIGVHLVSEPSIEHLDQVDFIAECPIKTESGHLIASGSLVPPGSNRVEEIALAPGEYSVGLFARGLGTKSEQFQVQLWRAQCREPRVLKNYQGLARPPQPLSLKGLTPAAWFDKANVVMGLFLVLGIIVYLMAWPILALLLTVFSARSLHDFLFAAFSWFTTAITLGGSVLIVEKMARAGVLPSVNSYWFLPLGNVCIVAAVLLVVLNVIPGAGIVAGLISMPAAFLVCAGLVQLAIAVLKKPKLTQ